MYYAVSFSGLLLLTHKTCAVVPKGSILKWVKEENQEAAG